ncbi:sensor histidine kinase [Marinomonas posidonica]|uniref:sensor histidine kinase n=1 Tax=Marinomonas posidonica TaxID=936476 RepID=UPI0037368871
MTDSPSSFWQKRLPDKRQLILALALLLLVVVSISVASYRFFWQQKESQLAWSETELLTRSSSAFSRQVGYIKKNTLLLRNSVKDRLKLYAELSDDYDWKSAIADEFRLFAATSELISQVRWMSADGMELVRVNSQGGVVYRVPEAQLQNKQNRPYIKQASIRPDDVYVSPLDLNVDNGEVVWPFQPTVRGVLRISGRDSGFLVVNYNLADMFDQLKQLNNDLVHLEVLDKQGGWIMSDDQSLEWGHVLRPTEEGVRMSSRFPDVWQSILSDGMDLKRHWGQGRLWSFMRFYLDEEDSLQPREVPFIYLVAHSEPTAFARWHLTLILSIALSAGIVYLLLAWWCWRHLQAQFTSKRLLKHLKREKRQTDQANQKLHEMNKRLVELQDELVETSKLSSLGMMVSGLAHDIYTPLGGVKLALSSGRQLIDKPELTPENIERVSVSLSIAEKNLNRALAVVSGFKRIASDRAIQDIQSFFFKDVLDDLLFTYQPRFKKRPKVIVMSECPERIEMQGYPGVMSQIVQNLLDNALEYAFHENEAGQIRITANQVGSDLELVVQDDGFGIASEIIGTVFDPFKTTGRDRQHNGLGLYLVHQWVYKLMKGRLNLESELGVGTRFQISIPLYIEK